MIWHYDMIAGEEIDVEEAGQTTRDISRAELTPMPRLITVQEAATGSEAAPVSPAMAMLPVETLLAQ